MTLRDKVRFECEPLCLGVQVDADSFIRRVKESVEVLAEHEEELRTFSYVYAATTNVVFNYDGKEKPALVNFKRAWDIRKAMSAADIWQWRLHTAHAILGLWLDDYLDAQDLIEVDPGQLPTDKLTTEQKKELANPDSPLAPNAKSSTAA